MKIFYDCEFLEDGRTINLISIGMVAEDGRELYAVSEEIERDPLHAQICAHAWLMANVIPHLPLTPGTRVVSPTRFYRGNFDLDDASNLVLPRRVIRNLVRGFIEDTPQPELWAWYGAYDHVVLAQLFGRMIDLPSTVPMYTHDLKQECDRLGNPPMPEQESAEHDALADARHIKVMAEFLARYAAEGGDRP